MSTPAYPAGISDHDATVLAARAIAPAVAADRGFRTITAADAPSYGFHGAQARAGLLIPCHNTQGINGAYQLRPHEPRLKKEDGKPIKYEWPAGKKITLDVPLAAQPFLDDIEIPVLITESPIKADAIMSAAAPGTVCAIAAIGSWGWRSGGVPLSDFRDIPLCTKQGKRITAHRRVVILFDSDTATNPKVADARQDLTEYLDRRGAAVEHVDIPIPTDPTEKKQGIDDALANGYTLTGLLKTAHRPRVVATDLITSDPDKQRIAELETENAELKTKDRETRRVLLDPRLTPGQRICAVFLDEEAERMTRHGEHDLGLGPARGTVRAVDKTGAFVWHRKQMADRLSIAPKTLDDFLKIVEGVGLVERAGQTRIRAGERTNRRGEIVPTYESTARLRPRGDMGTFLTDLLDRLPDPTPRAKPVPKNFCEKHPTSDILRTTTYECSVCGVAVSEKRTAWFEAGTPPDVEPERPDHGWHERATNDHHDERARMERQPELAFQEVQKVIPENAPLNVVASSPHVTIESKKVIPEMTQAQRALSDFDHAPPDNRRLAKDELADRLTDIGSGRGRKPDPKPSRSSPPAFDGVPF